MPRTESAQKSATTSVSKGFADEERTAMRERIREPRGSARRGPGADKGETAVLAKIVAMSAPDRAMGRRLHAIIAASAPVRSPGLRYGMPACVTGGNVVCFFQRAKKFTTRYATLGFSDDANLDDGHKLPTTFALTELAAAEEPRIGVLVKKAMS